MKLNNCPYDVAAITYDRFVVTVPSDKCVHFMSLKKQHIVSDRKVNINEECRGIACSNDKLVVSCNSDPGKVLVLDIQGNIMQSFSGDNSLFCYPYYVTVNTAGTSIYISDSGYLVKAVKQLDWQGNVINTYQPAQGGLDLRGICELNDGTFLVCLSQDSDDNLRRISDSCKPCKITINENVCGWYPRAVAYCKKTRKLYVSYSETSEFASRNCIKVFKVE
jgi:DNA-binding beta-propeller fold protein YncE